MCSNKSPLFLLACCLIVANIFGILCKPSIQEGRSHCISGTGLTYREIKDIFFRNGNCTVDCVTKHGLMQSFFISEGRECHNKDNYRCNLGKCKGPEDTIEPTDNLYSLEISINMAYVPDMDSLPTAGGSDVFVVVDVHRNGEPTYDDKQTVCHTYVIQDNDRPRWNFVCRPLPVRPTTQLKFTAIDSDKPSSKHDELGYAIETVEYLMNRGPSNLTLVTDQQRERPYFVQVDVKGKPYV